jgi:hypothetical protein
MNKKTHLLMVRFSFCNLGSTYVSEDQSMKFSKAINEETS